MGYYKVQTTRGVQIELTATRRAGIYRYTAPEKATFHVVMDLSHLLPTWKDDPLQQRIRGCEAMEEPWTR